MCYVTEDITETEHWDGDLRLVRGRRHDVAEMCAIIMDVG
jgi:hypothetical protein